MLLAELLLLGGRNNPTESREILILFVLLQALDCYMSKGPIHIREKLTKPDNLGLDSYLVCTGGLPTLPNR